MQIYGRKCLLINYNEKLETWKTMKNRCCYPQSKWCKPMKLTIKFTLTYNQVYLNWDAKMHIFDTQTNSALSRNGSLYRSKESFNPSCGSVCSSTSSLFPLAGCVTAQIQISVRKLIVTWSGSVFCRTNKLIQIKYKATACPDAMERSWRGHAASEHRGRQIPPLQWQLTDLIQHSKNLHLKSNSQYTF